MIARYTAGPHSVTASDHLGSPAYAVVANDGDAIAVGCLIGDAHLFAAAPELMEALELVVEMVDGKEPRLDANGDEICPFETARAAIAKARGEA